MTLVFLLACALLQVAPVEFAVDPTDPSDPYQGDEPCAPGTWTVTCSTCRPTWTRTAEVTCEGAEESWETAALDLVLHDLRGLREARRQWPAEDWTITRTESGQ